MWERISCVYLRPRGSFSANSCPIFIAFLQPEIQLAIDRSLPTPAHQRKALGTNESVRGFANSWICFTKKPCLNFGFYPVSIACLQAEIDTGESSRYIRKSRISTVRCFTILQATGSWVGAWERGYEKAKSANTLPFAVPFHVDAYFCMGAYKRDVVVVIKMGGCMSTGGAPTPLTQRCS